MTAIEEPAAACTMNIGVNERRKRMRFGVVLLGVGVAIAAAVVFYQAGRLSRLAVLLPFWAGGLGVFQARAKT
jgi:hypothetical protein